MDAFTDPTVSDIVLMTSAQVGKSEMLINVVGYIASLDPGPILFLQPTLEMAEAFSKDRVAPVIRDTPILEQAFSDIASRDSGNTLLHKQFAGGQLTLSGANSPASLASRPIRVLLADEIDRFPVSAGAEGDPLSLAEKRTNNFWNRKRVKVSTPTIKGASRIDAAYQESDRRRFFVPCPHCNEMQTLTWEHVKWPADEPTKAQFCCPHCGSLWTEGQKCEAITQGEWRGSAPFTGIAGFHINELYSPWRTLGQIATDFVAAKDNPERLKVWVNTSLGETWDLDNDKDGIDPGSLRARAEEYALGTVPAGALMVTMAVDVQGDRLEAYTWGYGPGEEAWVCDFREFYGDPTRAVVWEMLDEHLLRPLRHELGPFVVARTVAIDSGGHHTQEVYAFCRSHAARETQYGNQQVIAVKGQSQFTKPILGKATPQDIDLRGDKIPRGIKLWPVGSSKAKETLYGRLAIDVPGPGYIHTTKALPEEFFQQIVSERLITRYVKGFPTPEWHLPGARRNEALDCAVYAYAAAVQLGLPRMLTADWDRIRERLKRAGVAPDAAVDVERPPAAPAPVQTVTPSPRSPFAPGPAPRPRGANWMTGWK